ncbi:dihydrofolate synthase/folylpolyglutamate synthase [Sphingomonas naasensis]|uniref:Dihydrofolate synthase/folylpolyglutamate synthase n=1 Tax=Sphingomonas naasensis TaxID=1344951 RepID=A0A4V3QX96_9SPHN|nr:Mur ligase family protein [Sphingomonas naasensis]NIJ18373.1 dihydrofolate synthase/folylpolyglutamate synthase [Sphingomonas naasensis]TGX45642.1 bifunctional folylpolyglutamate synthase/dihydrofolate synthase [Sphingomonas naasensis]
MPDFATSTDPHVQRQLDRLTALSPGADILGLERITRLLARVGNPHLRLPPVLHVAGTNGKGSTCAFLRAALEAAGLRAHVYASPHLVRFNERIRLAGTLITDAQLAPLLEEVLDVGGDIGASFFEVTTAAAFLAFARTPADACILEVGLGGRLDATNVVPDPAATAIAQLGIDHQAFLGDTLAEIAAEKAGIAKPGVPLVTMAYPPDIAEVVDRYAEIVAAPVLAEGQAWSFAVEGEVLRYRDAAGEVRTPLPALSGPHQPANLALAIAVLRHQQVLAIPDDALATAARTAYWPARMQRLSPGPLTSLLPDGAELWLDGGHNANAAAAVSIAAARVAAGRPIDLVLGMLANKDAAAMIERFAPIARSLTAVPVPGHPHHPPAELAALARHAGLDSATAPDLAAALAAVPREGAPVVLILGSLYLAGTALEANDELPD